MSKVEPNRNVYVGHRYVPKIFGEWDKKNEYEGLSIVTHQGNSYTSKKRVPVGIDILNEEFWVITGNYDAQVEYYRQETEHVKNELENKVDTEELETFKNTTNADINQFKTDINGNITEFKDTTNDDINTFKTDINGNITDFKNESNIKINKIDTKINDLGVSASDFGIVSDGSIDVSDQLQALVNTAEDKEINLSSNGIYKISKTVNLLPETVLNGHNSKIILTDDVDGILKPVHAEIKNINFESGMNGYSSFFIKLDDKSGYSVRNTDLVHNITFKGDDQYLGKGIGSDDNNIKGIVTFLKGSKMSFEYLQHGVLFKNMNPSSWFNGNTLTDLTFYHCVHSITLLGINDGNIFSGQIQATGRTINGVRCEGNHNKFDMTLWDFYYYPDAMEYDFTGGSHNEINTNVSDVNPSSYKGVNVSNRINNNTVNGVVLPKVNTGATNVFTKNGSAISAYNNYNGNQDDVLTMADKHLNVNVRGSLPDVDISYVFRMNRTVCTWDMTAGETVSIDITPGDDKTIHFLDVLGATFTSDKPDNAYIVWETPDGTVRRKDFTDMVNPVIYTDNVIGATVSKITLIFNVKTDKVVRLSRIFASSRYMEQTSFIQSSGGTVHGNLEVDGQLNTDRATVNGNFEVTGQLITQSGDGTRYRLYVNNSGELTVMEL